LFDSVVADEIMKKFEPVIASNKTKLTVHINSFSYKKGIPLDKFGNGGGYVFDCRGILNPGRIEAYKTQTGRDKEVKEYLLHKTSMPSFLQHVFGMVDISVEDYIKRDFEGLTINFGCTGGQHRSVYAADRLAEYLKEKYKVKTVVLHVEQEAKGWVNLPY
jgi:RNase adaptor protein for sRNA GlmZ degradation